MAGHPNAPRYSGATPCRFFLDKDKPWVYTLVVVNGGHPMTGQWRPRDNEMKTYRITYRDADPGCPLFMMRVRAYDTNHAEELFFEGEDSDGWVIVKIEAVFHRRNLVVS